jgi:hypothetical protein
MIKLITGRPILYYPLSCLLHQHVLLVILYKCQSHSIIPRFNVIVVINKVYPAVIVRHQPMITVHVRQHKAFVVARKHLPHVICLRSITIYMQHSLFLIYSLTIVINIQVNHSQYPCGQVTFHTLLQHPHVLTGI